jgi:site-specific DNA recombinase
LGFESKKLIEEDSQGKKRSRFMLVPIPEEVELVKMIFAKYQELGSLTKLETYLMNGGYRTKKGRFYGRYVLRAMLKNPVYCVADHTALSFLKENNYGIYADSDLFDGSHGLIAYNKNNTNGKMQRYNEVEDWIVSVGEHEGIIDSAFWTNTQRQIALNGKLAYRQPRKSEALLSGIVRCSDCGALMRPKSTRLAKDGTLNYSYMCETKERSRGGLCQMPNILGRHFDEQVVDWVLDLCDKVVTEYDFLEKELDKIERASYTQSERQLLKKQRENNQRQIETLLNALGKSTSESTTDAILQRLDQMNVEQEKLKERMDSLKQDTNTGSSLRPENLLADRLVSMTKEHFAMLPVIQKKEILREVIREIKWNGETAEIHLCAEELPEVQSA